MPLWQSPLCLILGKNIQFDIMILLEIQEIILQGNMQCRKFYGKVPSRFYLFFEIFLPQLPVIFSTDLR